jgi:hypothetical protein
MCFGRFGLVCRASQKVRPVNVLTASGLLGLRLPEGEIGGENKVVEVDETFVGGKKKNVHKGKPEPKKHPVVAPVERDGEMRASHVADVTAETLRETLVTQANRKSYLMMDEAQAYKGVGKEFSGHGSGNSAKNQTETGKTVHKWLSRKLRKGARIRRVALTQLEVG